MSFKTYILFFIASFCSFSLNAAEYLVTNITEYNATLKTVIAGDIIVWQDGIYTDVTLNFSPINIGTEKNVISTKAKTAGKVVFTGKSNIVLNGQYLKVEGFLFESTSTLEKEDVLSFTQNSSNCCITNCAVINYSPKNDNVNNNWISLQGIKNEVSYCYFLGKTNQGPYLVVRYKTDKDFIAGSDAAPSTHHHIHHNYFGYRTLSQSNGGEDLRIGDSRTSFTKGFNIIEYNYFEEARKEAEVISNKSCDNIYRFNSFYANDGAMCLRHGVRCFVYGNYFNGKTDRNESAGIRIVNGQQTVFNNYLENLESGDKGFKAPIVIMAGLEGSELNEYYAADNAIVAYNTVYNSNGPAIKLGIGNTSKGKALVAPRNVVITGNIMVDIKGSNENPIVISEVASTYDGNDNFYTNGTTYAKGFIYKKSKDFSMKNGLIGCDKTIDKSIIETINDRLEIHQIKLSEKEITQFNPNWKLEKKDVGVSWIK
jgi:poly(beta-D-mannuronate) lyase